MQNKNLVNGKYGKIAIIENDYISEEIAVTGWYSINDVELLIRVVKKLQDDEKYDFNIIDIGSNLGCITIPISKIIKGRVFAFDVNPVMREKLADSIRINNLNNVEILKFGLGSRDAKVNISKPPTLNGKDNFGGVSITHQNNGEIAITTLDSFSFKNIGFIKIDAEGFEFSILQGALATISNNRPVIYMELIDSLLMRYGVSINEILNIFRKLKYTILIKDADIFCIPNEKKTSLISTLNEFRILHRLTILPSQKQSKLIRGYLKYIYKYFDCFISSLLRKNKNGNI